MSVGTILLPVQQASVDDMSQLSTDVALPIWMDLMVSIGALVVGPIVSCSIVAAN